MLTVVAYSYSLYMEWEFRPSYVQYVTQIQTLTSFIIFGLCCAGVILFSSLLGVEAWQKHFESRTHWASIPFPSGCVLLAMFTSFLR
jgi:hypothetical protein